MSQWPCQELANLSKQKIAKSNDKESERRHDSLLYCLKLCVNDFSFSRDYNLGDGKVSFPVNFTLQGDVTIVVYHARSTLGGKVQGKVTSMRVFMLQFHTGFIKPSAQKLKYSR